MRRTASGAGLAREPYLTALLLNPALHLVAVLFPILLVYAPSLDGYFHGDDFVALVDVASMSLPEHFWTSLTFQDSNFYWRPLGDAYYHAIYDLAGLEAFWFRAANLAVFVLTLLLAYAVARQLRISHVAALGAVLVIGLYPNHVVSVAWITNGSRLVAALFFLLSLLAVHQAISRRDVRLDLLGWLCFLLACLFDEVTIALAPVLALASLLLFGRTESLLRQTIRLLAYGIAAALIIPPQLMFGMEQEPRQVLYHFSPAMLEQGWALMSQLVLPLTESNPMDVPFVLIRDAQWAAGAVAIAVGAALFLFGSPVVRFLVFWTALGLAPFLPWDLGVVAPRYVYYSAVPFAILVAHLAVTVVGQTGRHGRWLMAPAAVTGLVVALIYGGHTTIERNSDFEAAIRPYEILGTGLPTALPQPHEGARILLYNGIWFGFPVWPEAVVRTVYSDPTLTVLNIPAEHVPAAQPVESDIIVYFEDGRFVLSP